MALKQIPRSQMKDFLNRPYSFNDDLKYKSIINGEKLDAIKFRSKKKKKEEVLKL